jgi:pilus assembly protein CpaE
MTDILLVGVASDLVERVAALGGHRVVSIDRYTVHGGKHAGSGSTEPSFNPELIFVGSGLPADQAIEYARVVIDDHPEISVVLVAKPDKALKRRAAKAGVQSIVEDRISDRDLARLVGKPAHESRPPRVSDATYPHQVIVVASPKGGVGKTTTAVSLAALLAEAAPGEVVLLDLDLQFGDVASTLDLTPPYTISDAFASGADDGMRLRTLLAPHEAGFYALCGSDDPSENGRVTGDQIRKLVHHYSASFRYVVIDTPAGLHEETLASLEEATDVVLVAGLDVATLRAMRREIDVLAQLSLLPPRRHLVLNRADRHTGLSEGDAERIIGLPIDVVVPVSDRVPMSANRGELVVATRKRNPIRRHFVDLTRIVADLSSPKGALT